ncbi:MAG: twin-arginine translocase TatA/TatE family subunit [Porticoccaceae bacterium]|nr:twin-arginine translocase TatA/TatE family subunit [Porticoccaceae bacterium]
MGLGGISIWQLLIILAIVVLIFGTKRLKSLGGDLGGAIKSFRQAVNDGEKKDDDAESNGESARLDQEKTAASSETKAKTDTHQS